MNTDQDSARSIVRRLSCLALLCLVAGAAQASVPGLISYQGVLNDAVGVPVNGAVTMTFAIYDVATGGTPLWSEIQVVTVSNGDFSVQLGAVEPLPSTVFLTGELYLGVKVGADAEMTPRQQLTSSAFSQRAETVKNKMSLHGSKVIGANESIRVDVPIEGEGESPRVRLFLRGMQTGSGVNVPSAVNFLIDGDVFTHEIGDPNSKGPTMFGESGLLDIAESLQQILTTSYWTLETKDTAGLAVEEVRTRVVRYSGAYTACVRVKFNYVDATSDYSDEWCSPTTYSFDVYVSHPNPNPGIGVATIEMQAKQDGLPADTHVSFAGHTLAGIWGVDGTTAWDTGELDLSGTIDWNEGEHFVEFSEFGGTGGTLIYLLLVN